MDFAQIAHSAEPILGWWKNRNARFFLGKNQNFKNQVFFGYITSYEVYHIRKACKNIEIEHGKKNPQNFPGLRF